MNINEIQASFQSAVASSVKLLPQGVDRYQIFTPFHFDDGDHFVITLRKDDDGDFILSDEGHTYMHLSYNLDVSSLKDGTRNQIIEGALEKYKVTESAGKIFAKINDIENAGNVFYGFIQCLLSITDISYLSRERVASTFMDDFKNFIRETVSPERTAFNYWYEEHDPKKQYLVDCRINSLSRPVHIYAIGGDGNCRDATINIWNCQSWKIPFHAMGIFEDQEQISRKVLSRFTDVCDRQFSSLAPNRERIGEYIQEQMA